MKSRTRGVVIYNDFAAASSQSPRSCSCCCTFQQTLGSCHFVLSLSQSLSALLLLLSLCVRLMSNFNLACKGESLAGMGSSQGAIPNGKQCKAVFSLLAHFESHVRVHFPRLVFHLSVDTLQHTHTCTHTHIHARKCDISR